MRKLRILLLCASTAASGPAAAAGSAGADSFEFLLLDGSARAAAMGGAYTALAKDANALLYNPAGLGLVKAHEAAFLHDQNVAGASHQYAGFASKTGWGAGLNYLRFGDITRATLSKPDGSLGRFGLSDLAVSAGYGHAFLDERLSLGLGAKHLRESIDGLTASGYAADAGALLSVPEAPGLSLGASVLNIGPDVRFLAEKEKLPMTMRGAAAYARAMGGVESVLAFDLSKTRSDKPRVSVGVETMLARMLALRAGYTSRNDAGVGITGGLGVLWRDVAVDYAFVPFGDLGIAHRVGLTVRWGARGDGPPQAARQAPGRQTSALEVEPAALPIGDDSRLLADYERMGRMALRRGEVDRARSLYTEALKLAASAGLRGAVVADAYAGLGDCLARQEDAFRALRAYDKALAAGPSPETRKAAEARIRELRALKQK